MEFGERLTAIRKEKKLSQAELAMKIGIHPNVLGRYERGEARPFVDMAIKIAQVLEISTDYLLGSSELDTDNNTRKRFEEISRLPESSKKTMYEVIDSMILGYKAKQTLGIGM